MNYYKRHLGDYAKNTRTLSTFEHGVYNLLIDLYYTDEAPITTDDAYSICRPANKKECDSIERVLVKFFDKEGDTWRHGRADEEIEAYKIKAKRNQESGKKGGRPKAEWLENDNPDANPEITQTVSKNNPSHKPLAISQEKEKKETAKAASPRDWLSAAGVETQVAEDWLSIRRAQKAPLTQTAMVALEREAGKAGMSVADAVKTCVEHSWRGFKADWINGSGRPKTAEAPALTPGQWQ